MSLLEVRPRDYVRLLRDREVDLVMARTAPGVPELDSAALRPTPAVLCLPAGHRLASGQPVELSQLDGERLLVWSRPGTPFTDLLLAGLGAAGAAVEPVESLVTGGQALTELAERGAVALMPAGTPPAAGVVPVQLADEVTLPLLVLWAAGAVPPAVRRVREAMSNVTPSG